LEVFEQVPDILENEPAQCSLGLADSARKALMPQ
jgi:hypothetical protein